MKYPFFFLIAAFFVIIQGAEIQGSTLPSEVLGVLFTNKDHPPLVGLASDKTIRFLLDYEDFLCNKPAPLENGLIALAQEEADPLKNPLDSSGSLPAVMAGYSAQLGLFLGVSAFQVVLDPAQKTSLFAEVTFPIKKILKKMGDRFEENEALILLERSVAMGNYAKAEALLSQMTVKLEAATQLFKDNLSSTFEVKEAEAEKAKAEAELTLARKNLLATTINAPYSGVVDSLFIEEYELPQSGKELIKIINDATLIAKMLVPSTLLPKVLLGTPVYLHISETQEVLIAKISRISGMIDPASSTLKVEAEINNKEGKFKAGMTGLATFDPPSEISMSRSHDN